MTFNYLKLAWRNITRNIGYSFLSITGLAVGMAVTLLIGLWVYYQFSYDRFLPLYKNIYQVRYRTNSNGEISTQNSVAYPLASVLKSEIPGIQYVVQTDWMPSHGLVAGEKKIYQQGIMAGSDFLKMFQYPLVKGSMATALADMYSIVLTESTAKALFGKEDPMNKTVRIDNIHDLKVTAIIKDIPANSSLQFSYIAPFDFLMATQGWGKEWGNNNLQTFVSLYSNVSYAQIEPPLKQLLKKYSPDEYRTVKSEVFLQPMKQWHLYSEFKNGIASGGLIDYVKMFSVIGILVLLIACINFTNLSTARSEKRAKEVAVRKAIGSGRRELVFQFLLESFLITLIAFVLCLVLVHVALPSFNVLTRANISIPYSSFWFWYTITGYILLTSLLAGSRPAFYLSSFQPVRVLKGTIQVGKAASISRKILVVLQFSCSVALIISTLTIYRQIQYAKNRPAGYDPNRLLMTDVSPDLNRNYEALKHDLLQSGVITNVTKSSSPLTGVWVSNTIDEWPGKQPGENLDLGTIAVSDADFFSTGGMQLEKGQNFKGNLVADSLDVLLNEAAVKRMRLKAPINQTILWTNSSQRLRIIGVVRDALMVSPFSSTMPTMFIYDPRWANIITYRLSPNIHTQEAISRITPIFNKYNPSYPFIYHFVDETYAAKFDFETLIGRLSSLFAALAIVISCLGLFGLAMFVAEQRTREVGIRKVLGASVSQICLLLTKDFVMLVLISCVIASPIAFYFLHKWLEKYEYRIHIDATEFIVAALIAVFIAILTISFQTIKAAIANPATSIKAE